MLLNNILRFFLFQLPAFLLTYCFVGASNFSEVRVAVYTFVVHLAELVDGVAMKRGAIVN